MRIIIIDGTSQKYTMQPAVFIVLIKKFIALVNLFITPNISLCSNNF